MFKRTIIVMMIACVVVGSMAMLCSAGVLGRGLTHAYNGSYWYDQGWVKYYASGATYDVTVWVIQDGIYKGERTTVVSNGTTLTCKSEMVSGSGGEEYDDITVHQS